MILARIRNLFAPPLPEPGAQMYARMADLEARVMRLEGEETQLLAEWVRTRSTITSQLKRLAAMASRVAPDEEEEEEAAIDREMMAMRFGGKR